MLNLENISKVFRSANDSVNALSDFSCSVDEGEFVVVRGPSGCGKSTLLLVAGGMMRPTSGRTLIGGQDFYALAKPARALARRNDIGFVFQLFHLVPYLNILDNVLMGVARGQSRRDELAIERATGFIKELGLEARIRHKPSQLSVGERQRVALARAMLKDPKIILADEPTGNLDPENSELILSRLAAFAESGGAVMMVTHGSVPDALRSRTIELPAAR